MSLFERPASTHIRCPRCRSRDFRFHEQVAATTTWFVKGGRLDRSRGYHDVGSITGLNGECERCGHFWRVRALQITSVVTEDDPTPAYGE